MRKSKKKEKHFLKKIGRVFLYSFGLLFLYGLIVIWPIRAVIPKLLTGKQLLLFTNENEARPCGGFLTAFGTMSLFPFELELKNVYHFEKPSFGETGFPLNKVSPTMKFWDLGTTSNLAMCANKFKKAYESVTDSEIENVILVDFATIERVTGFLSPIELEGRLLGEKDIFSFLSQSAANVDRHDEKSLEERKAVAADLGKLLIKKSLMSPFALPKITRLLQEKLAQGDIFMMGISPYIAPEKNDFAITEWNLGGGKSSRFLKKTLQISVRENQPDLWNIVVTLSVEHQGGDNEPLSQDWKGGFDIQFPDFLGGQRFFIEQELAPGEKFEKQFQESFTGKLVEHPFSVFSPRGQRLFLDVSIALFPEKIFEKASFKTQEGVGHYFSLLESFRKTFVWSERQDEQSPFVTLHEVISPNALTENLKEKFRESDLLAEVHFNERVILSTAFSAILTDRNVKNTKTDHPVLMTYEFLPDKKTLILGFSQETYQPQERFYLQLFGVQDFFGNKHFSSRRTLIPR